MTLFSGLCDVMHMTASPSKWTNVCYMTKGVNCCYKQACDVATAMSKLPSLEKNWSCDVKLYLVEYHIDVMCMCIERYEFG